MNDKREHGQGPQVLVVEDDAAINDVVCSYLGKSGYRCTAAFSGTEARLLLRGGQTFDLMIVDLMLPGVPGEDVVADARALGGMPIIVLSAKSDVSDKVDLLRIGADDYMTKPFDLEELLARVEVQVRRGGRSESAAGQTRAASRSADAVRFGDWELDLEKRTFAAGGRLVRLTRTEFEMVRAFASHPYRVFSKKDLSAEAWGDEFALEEKSVSTHIGNIRAKLKDVPTLCAIETVWGVGFRLVEGR